MNNSIDYPPKLARQVRVSDRIKHAVSLIARHGLTQVDAAKAAGLSRQGLNEALKRPEVAELLRSARAALDGDIAQLRQIGRLAAIEKAMQLMRESKDEKIQLRAAEFLAGESKGATPMQVNLDLRQEPATGYRYQRPEGYLPPLMDPTPPAVLPTGCSVID